MSLRILIAGRIPDDLRRDLAALEPGVELRETDAGEGDAAPLLADAPHLVLIGANAPPAARDLVIKTRASADAVPVLSLAEDPDADLDRILEILERRDLVRVVRRFAAMRRALVQLRGAAEETFARRLEYEFSRALRFRHPLSLLLLRHDHVERLTTAHGARALHAYSALLESALRRSLRDVDLLFRTGDDELATLLPETAAAGAVAVAERFLAQASRLVFKPADAGARPTLPMKITSSIGGAEGPRDGIGSPAALLARARESLQSARDAGGGRAALDRVIPS